MNGVLMTEQSNTYHYRAYLETLLYYNREEGATKLAPQGWVNQLNVIEEMGATGASSNTPINANWKGNAKFSSVDQPVAERELAHHHQTPFATLQDGQMFGTRFPAGL